MIPLVVASERGKTSEELGSLRKEIAGVNELKEYLNFFNAKKDEYIEVMQRDMTKYDTPEYFQDPTFKEIYQEALMVYGSNLDTERMIDLIEKYHPRYFLHGHVHMTYGRENKRYDIYEKTQVINAYERFIFDYEDDEPSSSKYGKFIR